MKISTRGRYALRMMIDLARHGATERPVSLAGVAERTDLSRGYLEQLALALRTASLVRSVAGRRGGYRLARAPHEITVREILEAAIGPVCVVECVGDPADCARASTCEARMVYKLVNARVAQVLDEYTLADLVAPGWVGEHAPTALVGVANRA